MHYNSFPQFKAGLVEAGLPKGWSDAKIDILFAHYSNARGLDNLTLGRIADTARQRDALGSVFDGKGGVLLTPKAQGFKPETAKQVDKFMDRRWSIWLNDAFILGGIHHHAAFQLISNADDLDYVDANNEFVFNVTQRELIGLITFGYSRGESTAQGTGYRCTDTRLADSATFKGYIARVDELVAAAKA